MNIAWKILIGLGVAVAIWLHGDAHGARETRESWRLDVENSDRVHAEELNRLNEAARAKETADSLHVRNLEAEHAKELETIRNGSSAFVATLTRRLRVAEARCAGSVVPSTAFDPSIPKGRTGQPESGYRGPDPASADRLREIGMTLQAQLRDCRSWVLRNGR